MSFAKRVALFPSESTNGYGDSTRRVLERAGFSVSKLPPLLSREVLLRRFQVDVIIVSWLDNYLVCDRSGRFRLTGLFKFVLALLLMRRIADTLVFVRHNSIPHHYRGGHQERLEKLIDWLERRFDHVVVHSPAQTDCRRCFIGHPLYASTSATVPEADPHPRRLLMFGTIAPYKGILDVIAALPAGLELEIAGPAVDASYLEQVQEAARGKNVIVVPGFIEDGEIIERLRSSRGLLIAQAHSRNYVSGVLMFALSHRVPAFTLSNSYAEWVAAELPEAGIFVFDTVPQLLAGAMGEAPFPPSRAGVEDLFGDVPLGLAWRKLLDAVP